MKFDKGRYTNTRPINQPKGTWLKGSKNLNVSQHLGSIASEYGFELKTTIDTSSRCCGIIRLDSTSYALFLAPSISGNPSKIQKINLETNTVEDVIENEELSFNINSPIYGTSTVNYKNERIVAFASKTNKLKIINIDNPEEKINKLDVFPNFSIPTLTIQSIEKGGDLQIGSYFFVTRYKSDTGQITPFQIISNPVRLYNALKEEEDNSNKQIKILLSDIDINFDSIEIACVKNINGELVASSIKEERIDNNSSIFFVYSGSSSESTLLLEEIINPYIAYIYFGEVSQHEDNLYLTDLREQEVENSQFLANNIRVQYKLEAIEKDDLIDSSKVGGSLNTFMPDEVYALYISYRFPNGKRTPALHIPGRAPIASDRTQTIVPFSNIAGRRSGVSETTYEDKFTLISTFNSTSRALGYWENKNEKYPNKPEIWGNLAGVNVRHHRMPDYRAVFNHNNQNYSLIKLELTNVILPEGATGYEIFYAKRTEANSLVKGYDLAQSYGYEYFTGDRGGEFNYAKPYNTGGNWDLKYTTGSGVQGNAPLVRAENFWYRLKLHPFDYIKEKAALDIDFIKILHKIRITNINTSKDIFVSGENRGLITSAFLDVLANDTVYEGVLPESVLLQYAKIRENSLGFVPEHSISGDVQNLFGEEHYTARVSISGNSNTFGRLDSSELTALNTYSTGGNNNSGILISPSGFGGIETSFFIELCSYKLDLYVSYKNQILISTGKLNKESSTEIMGDSYLGVNTFFTSSPTNKEQLPIPEEIEEDPEFGKKDEKVLMIRRHAGYFANNPHLRQYTREDYNTYFNFDEIQNTVFYDELQTFVSKIGRFKPSSKYIYNNGFKQLNEFSPIFPEDEKPKASVFPFRIVKSIKFDSDNINNNWFRFLVGDFYDIQKNKGRIIKVISKNGRLLIHTEEALFQSATRETLKTEGLEVTLTTGDLFRQVPIEIVESEIGYAGLQNKFAQLNTEMGYIFIDVNQAKVFIFNDKLTELQNEGVSLEFNTIINQIKDNPFNDEGIILGYDNLYNRIFITQLQQDNSFTISYSFDLKAWAFEHDYVANFFLYTRKNRLFSLKQSSVYEHNIQGSNTFYTNIPIECKLVIVINPLYEKDKQLFNINWITTLLKEDNVLRNKTFSKIRVYNDYQDTGLIDLIPFESLVNSGNIRKDKKNKNTWNFNDIKDQAELFYNKNRLVSKYFIVELFYVLEAQEELLIEDIDFKLKLM